MFGSFKFTLRFDPDLFSEENIKFSPAYAFHSPLNLLAIECAEQYQICRIVSDHLEKV